MDTTSTTNVFSDDWFEQFAGTTWNADEPPVRFALVGLGEFATGTVLPAIESVSNATPTTLVSGSSERAESIREACSADHVLSYEQFEAGEMVSAYDAIYVATPNTLHLDAASTGAELGKSVLCEKPLDGSLDQTRRIVESCDENNVDLGVAYRVRYKPSIRWLRRVLQSGVLGTPRQIHSGISFDLLETGNEDQWRADPQLAGGGAMVDIGVYPLNTIRYLLDEDPVHVTASTVTSESIGGMETEVSFGLTFPDDTQTQCTASYRGAPANHLRVVGTKGEVLVEGPYIPNRSATLTVKLDGNAVTVEPDEANEVGEMIGYFADKFRDDAERLDGTDGLKDMEIVDAIYDAAETGTTVPL